MVNSGNDDSADNNNNNDDDGDYPHLVVCALSVAESTHVLGEHRPSLLLFLLGLHHLREKGGGLTEEEGIMREGGVGDEPAPVPAGSASHEKQRGG